MTWTAQAVDPDRRRFIALDGEQVAIADLERSTLDVLKVHKYAPLGHGTWQAPDQDDLARFDAALPALRRVLTAAGDWDPEKHPRGEHGRFVETGGSETNDRSHGMPSGWKPATEASLAAQYQAGGMRLRDAREYAKGAIAAGNDVWQSEDDHLTLEFLATAHLTEADKQGVAETVAKLAATDPFPPPAAHLTVSVVADEFFRPAGAYGLTRSRHNIEINDNVFAADHQSRFRLEQALGMKSRAGLDTGSTLPQYVLTHEYGHALDDALIKSTGLRADSHGSQGQVFRDLQTLPPVSEYGDPKKTNVYEAYAEAYAEWRLSAGKTTQPMAVRVAQVEGWAA